MIADIIYMHIFILKYIFFQLNKFSSKILFSVLLQLQNGLRSLAIVHGVYMKF